MKKITSFVLLIAVVFCLAACGGNKTTVDMQQVYDSFSPYLPEMVILDEDSMLDKYGVDNTKCTQAIISTCSDGLRSDEIWLVEAIDEESAAQIAELAQARVDREAEETKNYAPDQYAVVEKAQIIAEGNNVVLIISPDVDTLVSLYNEAIA